MIKNYLTIAIRNIWKNKLHSAINIFGLAIAFIICNILFLTAYFKLGYNSFHEKKDHIYQVYFEEIREGNFQKKWEMPMPMLPALQAEVPEIGDATRIYTGRRENISNGDVQLGKLITRVDPAFFEIFSFEDLDGQKHNPLQQLNDIALTESTAVALFGSSNVIGKSVSVGTEGNKKTFTVSAVMKDSPVNSSIQFDALSHVAGADDYALNKTNWDARSGNIYVTFDGDENDQTFQNKMAAFAKKNMPDAFENGELNIKLLPLNDVHFKGAKSTPIAVIYAIIALGALILIIASFNFVNLNLARSFGRSREIGVRKSLGALKSQLFFQLWGEASLMYFLGFVLGIVGALYLIPVFNSQFDARIHLETLFEPGFAGMMLLIFFMVTLIAGGLPAMRVSGLSIVDVLKGKQSNQKPGKFRNGLLVGQFAISALLICLSWIAKQQLDHLNAKPVGFTLDQVISIPVGSQHDGRVLLERMKNTLSNDANVVSFSGSSVNMGKGKDRVTSRTTLDFEYGDRQVSADLCNVDVDYLKTLGIALTQGRDFDNALGADAVGGVIVTESFAKAIGEENPVGKFYGGDETHAGNQIIGVVKDFNLYSPTQNYLPIILEVNPQAALHYIFVKVNPGNAVKKMEVVENAWAKISNNAEFNGSYLDENVQAWYDEERVMTSIFGIASVIAIFLSSLGLFALALIVIEMRTKEIGLRKVMGASVTGIVTMLSNYFLRLALVSLLIALPLAWLATSKWLDNYAYRIDLEASTFIIVGIGVCLLTLGIVSYHSIRIALMNPVKSLKNE